MNDITTKLWLVPPSIGTTATGYKSPTRNVIQWYNINLQNMLGFDYDKYKKFKLNLLYVASQVANQSWANTDDLNVQIVLTGLPIVYASYQTANATPNSICSIATYQFTNGAPNTTQYDESNSVVFIKQNAIISFGVQYLRVIDGAAGTSTYPNCHFGFSIAGVE